MILPPFDRVLARLGLARFSPRTRALLGDATDLARYLSERAWSWPIDADDAGPGDDPGLIDLSRPPERSERWPPGWRPKPERFPLPSSGCPELRSAVAELHGERTGLSHDPDQVWISAGAVGAFAAAAESTINPGDPVAVFDPTSPAFLAQLNLRRASPRWLTSSITAGRMRVDFDQLRRSLPDAKWLILSDPVNPTGARFDRGDLDTLVELTARSKTLVWLDRTYLGDRPEHEAEYWPVADHWVRVESLSSGGVRVGACVGRPALLASFRRAAELHGAIPTGWSQRLALAILRRDAPFEDLSDRAALTVARLRSAGLTVIEPAGGPFVWAEWGPRVGPVRPWLNRLRRDCRVAVAPGSRFGPDRSRWFRVTVAGDEGRWNVGLSRLVEELGRLG